MNIKNKAIVEDVFSLYSKILMTEKKQKFEYENQALYPSEIHLIIHIHTEDNTNITKIADKLNVTKGAVSKLISRLEKKGVIIKNKDPFKKNEMTVEFTDFGQRFLNHYLEQLSSFQKMYDDYFENVSEYDRSVITDFLNKAMKFTDVIMNQ